jgi:hypothetical protein
MIVLAMNVLAMNAREKIAKAMIVREMTEDSKTKQHPLAHKSKGIFFGVSYHDIAPLGLL